MKIKLISTLILIFLSVILFAQKKQSVEKQRTDTFDVVKERSGVKYRFVPLPSYDPSTKFGINLMNLFAYYPNKNDLISPASMGGVGANFTSNGSWIIGGGNTLYLKEDAWRITTQLIYGRINQELDLAFNDGDSIVTADAKREMTIVNIQALRKIYKRLYFGMGYSYRKIDYSGRDDESDDSLKESGLTEGEGNHGLKYFLTNDERDNVNYPYHGFYAALRSEQYFKSDDALDDAYWAHYFDFRHFIDVSKDGKQIIAYRVLARFLTGNPQAQNYTYYGRTGGDIQRGYETGKYIDENMLNFEAEYRLETSLMKNRLGFAGFLGMGKVFGEYYDFSDADWLPMGGLGVRYRLMPYERMNVRFDIAAGNEGVVFYFGVLEAF